jgi:hypothetical protein
MCALVAVLLGTAVAVSAATPSEFYLGLLRRGTASYEANRHADAVKQLRIAAFGLVEAIDQYQLAQVYLTLTYDKLSDPDRAREAAHRVFVAERVERKYAALPLTPAVRTSFEAIAGRLLSATESAILLRGAEMTAPSPAPQRVTATPQTSAVTPRRTTTTASQTKPVNPPPANSQASNSQPTQPRNTIPAPQTTKPENVAPQTITAMAQPDKATVQPDKATVQPEKPKPAPAKSQTTVPAPQPTKQATTTTPPPTTPQPAASQTKPAQTATAQQRPATTTKVEGSETDGRGGPIEPRPATAAPTPRALSASEVVTRLAAAERGLNAGNLTDARRAYRELLGVPGLEHETLIRVAEGLYRARDFSGALSAFNRVGTLRRGEEPYRYYIAVALYETGDFARAKKELAAALPYIEVTPDVARYRTKIEGSL